MTHQEVVKIKGGRGGLSLVIEQDARIESVIDMLRHHIGSSKSFFQGASLRLQTTGRSLTESEMKQLTAAIEEFGVVLEEGDLSDDPAVHGHPTANTPSRSPGSEESSDMDEHPGEPAVLVKRTLRSGQSVSFDGNVMIRGDVNPGAIVIATGDIIVLGALRGVAHAGASGDGQAVVMAFRLEPTQLRIAGHISRAPDGKGPHPAVPEVARVRGDSIVIEEYRP